VRQERCGVLDHRCGEGRPGARTGSGADDSRRHRHDDHGGGRVKRRRIDRRTALLLIVGGDVLLLVLGWLLLVSPQRSTAASIARSPAGTKPQLAVEGRPAPRPGTITQPKQPEIRTAYLYKLSKAMPMTTDMPNL